MKHAPSSIGSKQPLSRPASPIRPLDDRSLREVRGGGSLTDGGITAMDDWEAPVT